MTDITLIAKGSVRGFLHRPAGSKGDGLVLTHGAGANCQTTLLLAVAHAFTEAGWWVLRCDLPFRQRNKYGPPTPASAVEDRNALRQAAEELRSSLPGRICLGGHSYGGRQESILAAEEPRVADGLLLFSYPLHPPKKPQAARTSHFPRLQISAMFVHGTNDPFGSIEEIRAALAIIPAPTELITIQNAGHDLLKGSFDIAQRVIRPFQAMLGISES